MDELDRNSQRIAPSAAGLWLLIGCSTIAAAVALSLAATLLVRKSPTGLVVGAALAVFPILPLAWHALAEATGGLRADAGSSSRSRFALRAVAVALVVLGVSFAEIGPRRVGHNLHDLWSRVRPKTSVSQQTLPPGVAAFGLEPFIPADATLAVGLAGSEAMGQLLAAHGLETRAKLAALATCKIDLASARVLIASRGLGTHLIVVRAPGITEERNLYCLVGVMGAHRLQLRTDPTWPSKLLEVKGISSRPLLFRAIDTTTMIAADGAWQNLAGTSLVKEGIPAAAGPLGSPLERVGRGGPLWLAAFDDTQQGAWDLAIDSRQEGNILKLMGSSTPPSGEEDRAEISARVPLAFASALPASAVALGTHGVIAALMATAGSSSADGGAP